ncbi:hypothetical protein [Lacticaseibacillus daqingensis]|uniref:hypothetical protein n=1 Tax=Lacticaseibacillus daqingensis TaxID=2486014 RepID=UPI0013DDB3B6|nr:hypothetical protein [Lacticaseibacillus daqingensis]
MQALLTAGGEPASMVLTPSDPVQATVTWPDRDPQTHNILVVAKQCGDQWQLVAKGY